LVAFIRCRLYFQNRKKNSSDNTVTIGFFHPNCAAFGGGERVLWMLIQALDELQSKNNEKNSRKISVFVYTRDALRPEYASGSLILVKTLLFLQNGISIHLFLDLLKQVKERFSIIISPNLSLSFVHLHDEALRVQMGVGDESIKRSMVGESIQSMRLAWAAIQKRTPDIFFDTTGYAFTFFIVKILAGCTVATYVHYPTIRWVLMYTARFSFFFGFHDSDFFFMFVYSTDMLALVWERRPTYNNKASITSSSAISYLKLLYYILFACLYGLAGSLTDIVFVNSSWTYGHIHFMWRWARHHIHILFPPCNTQDLQNKFRMKTNADTMRRKNYIVSIGQFRPEKDHALQIRSFARLYQQYPQLFKEEPIKLVLIGGCRCKDDEQRVHDLKLLASSLMISDYVEFVINQPYSIVQDYFLQSSIGLHTMWNEHFGIGIVEMMAAGVVVIAHNSGGPKSDIIIPGLTGYLASNEEEFADLMYNALKDGPHSEMNNRIREAASASVTRFSDEAFVSSFQNIFNQSRLFVSS
jgi:alpha-1,2-mannosyltransferase